MSVQRGQSSGDQPADSEGRRFSTLISSLAAAASAGRADQDERAADGGQAPAATPTFTPWASGPATMVTPEPTDTPEPDSSGSPNGSGNPDGSGNRVRRAPAIPMPAAPAAAAPAPVTSALPDEEGTRALPRPAAAMSEPLLADAAALRARWQQVQASFVDGPQEAVGDAADLIEQTAQALIGALRQRQRQLRVIWESGTADASSDGEPASRAPDTEHLRQMMQHYRALFNQLCRP